MQISRQGPFEWRLWGAWAYVSTSRRESAHARIAGIYTDFMNDQEKLESQVIGKQEKGIPKGKKYIKKEKVNSMKNNNSNRTNGMHNTAKIINYSIPLTREHQVHVSTPRDIRPSNVS